MKIKCIILGRDRTIRTQKVNTDHDSFRIGKRLYYLPREAVRLTDNPYPELIYREGIPTPLGWIEHGSKILGMKVVDNFVLSTASPTGLLLDRLKDFFNAFKEDPKKMLILLGLPFAVYFGYLLITYVFSGGLF